MMKQLILITDGCSNVGINPAAAAAHARAEDVVVNVIGVVGQDSMDEAGAQEIAEIARAGGGMSRIVHTGQLSRTVQMMTRQTVTHTIRQAVHRELADLYGEQTTVESLPPAGREKVVRVMEDLGENTQLRVAVLVDASASMRPKLASVQEAVKDLMLSLQARRGQSEAALFHYPGQGSGGETAHLDMAWTGQLVQLEQIFRSITMKGTTPTGPAILDVIRYFGSGRHQAEAPDREDGVISDYVL